ncbi:hypothetical protein TRVA0_004S02190 [Trichomonascus vanleenenianus]|uniref:uncharacterized protein n=1 Tax=Trichomonascus vanleenenianus TaxID=2268995 RepID=UPI003EC98E07
MRPTPSNGWRKRQPAAHALNVQPCLTENNLLSELKRELSLHGMSSKRIEFVKANLARLGKHIKGPRVRRLNEVILPADTKLFGATERAAYANIFGTPSERKKLEHGVRQRHYDDVYQRLSQSFEDTGIKAPYPDISGRSIALNACMKNFQLYKFALILECQHPKFIKYVSQKYSMRAERLQGWVTIISRDDLRSVLWAVDSGLEPLDYWKKDISAAPPMDLLRLVRAKSLVIFFDHQGDGESLEQLLKDSRDEVKVKSLVISLKGIGDQGLENIIANLNSPWRISRNDECDGIAQVLKEMSSYDLVHGFIGPGKRLCVTNK